MSGPGNKDHPLDCDRVKLNLLFAHQISMFCCFGSDQMGPEAGNSEITPNIKGYMMPVKTLRLSNTRGFVGVCREMASVKCRDQCFFDCHGLMRLPDFSMEARYSDGR